MAENIDEGSNSAETPFRSKDDVSINTYRRLVRSYINQHQYIAAEFWADKVVSLSDGDPEDVYWLAQCLFLMKQYHRAAHLIRKRGLERKNVRCHYLAARCLLEAKEPSEALQVLEANEIDVPLDDTAGNFEFPSDQSRMFTQNKTGFSVTGEVVDGPANMHSAVLFLKGQVYEAMDNRGLAAECYKQALYQDVHCYEAFDSLVQHHMLTAWEEQELLESLPISKACSPAEERFLRFLYKSKLKKYDSPNQLTNELENYPNLATNLDLAVSQAEKYYYNCNYTQCSLITTDILKKDPYHRGCLPVHISCLVELLKYNELFYLGHKLVDLYPEMAISWFAVGCYYYTISKSDPARRYLAKSTAVDRLFGPAWLAYGHSFAAENEHDQAMAAYFKASQLMKGCHLPLLYIGLECGLTNNIKLADKFFMQAKSIAPDDPFVLHEMGVIAYQNLEFETARRHFTEALDRVRAIDEKLIADKWEPLLNNLGHTCRKLGLLDEALEYHRQALLLSPMNPSTYSAMGFIYALLNKNGEAVEAFHKALGIRRDDTFSTTMLNQVIQELMDELPPFEGAPDELPNFCLPSTSGLHLTYPGTTDEEREPLELMMLDPSENTRKQIMLDASGSSSGSTVEVEMQDSSRIMIESD